MQLDEVLDAHERASTRFAELLRSLDPDPVPVPPLTWSTAEVGAHVLSLFRGYTRAARTGQPLWPSTDGLDGNQRLLDETPERDHAEIATALGPAGAEMREALAAASGPINGFGELTASPAAILAINMVDTLVHGFDIAHALGRRWEIAPGDAALGLEGTIEILPGFIKPESRLVATYRISLRGAKAWTFQFDRGVLRIAEQSGAKPDCRISADPTAWLLTSYGRTSPLVAALTGKVVAYGRKPWLAPRVADQFNPP